MLITKAINHNAALARDEQGNELVIFATGVGFPKTPYVLDDESKIQRVFHHVGSDLLKTIGSLSAETIAAVMDIVHMAEQELSSTLNPNLYLTLADHLQFSAERYARGVVIENPLAGEIPFVYPREYALGKQGLVIMKQHSGYDLPEVEACAIALHIVNAEGDGATFSTNLQSVMKSVEIIDQIIALIESRMGELDRTAHGYLRFVAHLRYLIKRLATNTAVMQEDATLLNQVAKDFPASFDMASAVGEYLAANYGWHLTSEEMLYLMMYINRLESDHSRHNNAGF